MPVIFLFNGIAICLFGFDHNPPHIHIRKGEYNFSITLDDRIVQGRAPIDVIKQVNDFIDEHKEELMLLWDKAQKGEKINKIER